MKILTMLTALFIASFAISCQNSANNDGDTAIKLNNGKKWEVNSEMSPFILAAEKMLTQYDKGNYKAIAKQLTNKNKGLIKSCTMDGKSHDELHKWLHPHMKLVASLGDAENEQKANEIIVALKESFSTYHTYFQ